MNERIIECANHTVIQHFLILSFKEKMKKKIFLNAFYSLAMILCIIGALWGYKNQSPLITIFLVAALAAFLFFKIKLIKEINKEFRQGPPKQ